MTERVRWRAERVIYINNKGCCFELTADVLHRSRCFLEYKLLLSRLGLGCNFTSTIRWDYIRLLDSSVTNSRREIDLLRDSQFNCFQNILFLPSTQIVDMYWNFIVTLLPLSDGSTSGSVTNSRREIALLPDGQFNCFQERIVRKYVPVH